MNVNFHQSEYKLTLLLGELLGEANFLVITPKTNQTEVESSRIL